MKTLPPIQYYRPKAYVAFVLLLVIGFDVFAARVPFMKVKASSEAAFPYVCGALFILMAWVTFKIAGMLLDGSPSLAIDAQGFHDRTSAVKHEFVPWSQVESMALQSAGHEVFVSIKLKPEDGLVRVVNRGFWSRANRALGYGEININPKMCGRKATDLLNTMNGYLSASRKS